MQKRKIRLLRHVFIKRRSRQQHNRRISIENSSFAKIDEFNQLQEIFNRFIFLIYFDNIKILYIDIDVNKKRNFDIIIYHVKRKNDVKSKISNISFKRMNVKLIIFFNKMLSLIENRY